MKRPRTDEEACLKAGAWWWWRYRDEIFEPDKDRFLRWLFFADYQRSAYQYELAARINGQYEFGQCHALLTWEQKDVLARRWPMRKPYGWSDLSLEKAASAKQRPGWTKYHAIAVNLHTSDESLVKLFRRFVAEQRRRQNIPPPRPNAGRRNRPLSWRVIELLDIRRFNVRPLNDSERKQVSKARRSFKASI